MPPSRLPHSNNAAAIPLPELRTADNATNYSRRTASRRDSSRAGARAALAECADADVRVGGEVKADAAATLVSVPANRARAPEMRNVPVQSKRAPVLTPAPVRLLRAGSFSPRR